MFRKERRETELVSVSVIVPDRLEALTDFNTQKQVYSCEERKAYWFLFALYNNAIYILTETKRPELHA